MSAIGLLCGIIAQGTKASAASYRANANYELLLEHDYIQEVGTVSSITCSECNEAHDAEIIFEGGQYGHFCPELGFAPLTRDSIIGLTPNLPLLIKRLAEGFACKRRKATPLHRQTWRIGAVTTDHGDVVLYFHPRLHSEDNSRNLAEALAREMKTPWRLIVTAEGRLPVENALIITLEDLVQLDGQDGRLVRAMDLLAAFGIPEARKGGRPNQFGSQLRELMQARIADGKALSGRNEEAKAVLAILGKANPYIKQPSLLSVKGYVTKVRSELI